VSPARSIQDLKTLAGEIELGKGILAIPRVDFEIFLVSSMLFKYVDMILLTGHGLELIVWNIGGLVGLPFAPFVSDRYGRRAAILFGCISESSFIPLLYIMEKADKISDAHWNRYSNCCSEYWHVHW
jgi:MFS family permease